MKPLIGISCCTKIFGPYLMTNHAASDYCVRAVTDVAEAIPVLLPAVGARMDIEQLLSRLDGLLLTGSRSMVSPCHYGGPAHAEGTPEDPARDATTLPLIRAALARGLPILAICRGLQELNVALGGTLHQRLADLPGRLDHSTPLVENAEIRVGKAHAVAISSTGRLRVIAGRGEIPVNSLHHQGIDRVAPGLRVEAIAPDGTIEAVHSDTDHGFALGVQWHPEFDFPTDQVSRNIFGEFGAAARVWMAAPMMQRLAAD